MKHLRKLKRKKIDGDFVLFSTKDTLNSSNRIETYNLMSQKPFSIQYLMMVSLLTAPEPHPG
jgi:hypothetical protein